MRAVIGLGNPGDSYKFNRHNIGLNVLDYIAEEWGIEFSEVGENYVYAQGKKRNNKFLLCKPTTYMNSSGKAVKSIVKDFDLQLDQILVIHDEINLGLGSCKMKLGGGDGGHNGMASIAYELISDRFARIRVGIGNTFSPGKLSNYVLSDFKKDEIELITQTYDYCLRITEAFVTGGLKFMLDFNSKLLQKKK